MTRPAKTTERDAKIAKTRHTRPLIVAPHTTFGKVSPPQKETACGSPASCHPSKICVPGQANK